MIEMETLSAIEKYDQRRSGPMKEEIPKAAWKKFLDDVTEFRAGWLVTLELLDPDYGDQHEADHLPLFTIEYDDEDDTVIVELLKAGDPKEIGLRHLVEHPSSIEADPPAPTEVNSIRIQGPGNVTIVELQPVPELPAE